MRGLKKCIGAVTAAALLITAIPVNGLNVSYAAGETDIAATVRLQPGQASPFHDTDGDGLGEFEGWGTSLCWWANRLGYDATLTSKAAEAFFSDKGLDMNIGRYNVGGGDLTGEVPTVPVNEKAQFYDLETTGHTPTYAGTSMEIKTWTGLKDSTYTKSDADFGITKGTKVGEFKYIGYVNKLDDAVGSGDNLHYTVNVQDAGKYTVKLLLMHNNNTGRDVAIRVNPDIVSGDNGAQTHVIANEDVLKGKIVGASGSNQTLFVVTIPNVILQAGDNTINVAGKADWTLDYVKMAVVKAGEEGVLTENEFLHPSHIKRSDSVVPGYAKDVTRIDTTKKTLEEYQQEFARVDEESGFAWNYDWEADKNQLNILKAAMQASGQEFIAEAFSNSPPYFMTNSGCSSGAVDSSTDNLRADSYNAFAAYMADVIVHWAKNGITFQSATPMNEPDTSYWGANSNKQEGCHFDPGRSQSNIIVAMNKELKALAAQPENADVKEAIENIIISGTDETDIDKSIASYNKLSAAAKEVVSRIDTHTYSGSKRAELSALAEENGLNLWMSEVDGAYTAGTEAGEMTAALGLTQRIMTDLNGLRASAWILWNAVDMNVDQNNEFDQPDLNTLETAVSEETGKRFYDKNTGYWGIAIGDHNNKEVVKTRKYYAYGQFSRYIRPGYTLIASSNKTLAAYDPKGKKAVIVALNTAGEDQTWKFDLSNFKTMGSTIQAIRTSGAQEGGENWADVTSSDNIAADTASKSFTATMKANSITTYIVEGVTYDRNSDETVSLEELELNKEMVSGSAPWNNDTANGPANVVDGKLNTFFDGVAKGWVQIDLGEAQELAAIAYAPRSGYTGRCVNASFYGSNDGKEWTLLHTIAEEPTAGSYTYIYAKEFQADSRSFRYIKYAVPEDDEKANCNIAEIKLFGKQRTLEELVTYYQKQTEGKNYVKATKDAFDQAMAAAQALKDSTDQEARKAAADNLKKAYTNLKISYTYDSISGVNGDVRYDDNGTVIQAHGGQIQQLTVNGETKYYWIGEDKTNDYRPCAGIHMYTSTDLYNWKDEGLVLKTMTSMDQFETDDYFKALYGDLKTEAEKKAIYTDLWQGEYSDEGCVIERPKMLYNEKTNKYVIWFHADGQDPFATESGGNYAKAKAGVAIADSPTGPYKLLGSYLLNYDEDITDRGFDKEGGHVRDMNVFKDDDGTAYVMYSSDGNQNMYIAKLNDEYTNVAKPQGEAVKGTDFTVNFVGESREAPAMFKYKNKYYMVTSGCTGWAPNPAKYAVADQPLGPWTLQEENPCTDTGKETTYDTQSTCVFPVDAAKGKFIYMGDRWDNPDKGGSLRNSRYVWLPVEFTSDGAIAIRRYSDWDLSVWDTMGELEVETKLPESAVSVAALKEALPKTLTVKIGGQSKELAVTWSGFPQEDTALGTVTILGTLAGGRQIEHTLTMLNDKMIYFFDCARTKSEYLDLAKASLGDKLRNTATDQAYTAENRAGYAGILDTDFAVKNDVDQEDMWTVGYWAKGSKNIDYDFDLEAGTYTIAAGFHEWWASSNPNRNIKINIKSGDNTLGSKEFNLSGSAAMQQNVSFTMAANGKVTVSITKPGSGADPVLSWIAVIQDEKTGAFADKAALNEAIKKAEALKQKEYMSDSWKALQDVYKKAQSMQSDINATQEEIDAAKKELEDAITALKTVKSYLEEAIKENTVAEDQKGKYTAESWQLYENMLKEAKDLLAGSNLTETAATDAVNALKAAKDALEPKPGTGNKKNQSISYTKTYTKTYGSKAFKLDAKVKTGNGKLSYKSSNEKVAKVSTKGTVTIKGAGTCTISVTAAETSTYNKKTVKVTIKIKQKAQSISYTKSYSKAYGSKAFKVNAKVKTGNGKLSFKSSDKKVATVSSTTGKVTIKGTGACTITVSAAATKNYTKKTVKITIKVSPKKQALTSVKAVKGKKLTVKWKKDTRATGYEVQYCLKKNFKSGVKKVNIKKNKTTSTTIKSLKKGKKYYVRVRAYKTAKVSGKSTKLYGAWSSVKLSGKVK